MDQVHYYEQGEGEAQGEHVQGARGPVRECLELLGLQLVKLPVDDLQRLPVAGHERDAPGCFGDIVQGLLIEEPLFRASRIAEPDGVDRDSLATRQAGRPGHRDLATGVVSVGEQHQDPLTSGAVLEGIDGESDGIPQHGLWAGRAYGGLGEEFPNQIMILSEGGLKVGGRPEEHEADPVAFPTGDEPVQNLLNRN